jgi:glucuronoarabinoxylan endo-1,4-beta-xylanase
MSDQSQIKCFEAGSSGRTPARRTGGALTARVCIFLAPVLLASIYIWSSYNRRTDVIEWSDVRQTIDGFGGSSADFLIGLTPAQADFYFTPAGIGLSILRTQIIPDVATCNAEFHNGVCSNSNGQILNGELSTAEMAVARGARIFASPWSPPGAYKSNGSFRNGGTLLRPHYSDWASEMAQEIHDFVPYLYASLRAVGAGSTKIMIAEESHWSVDLTSAAMEDPRVAPDVGIIAAHGYAGKVRPLPTRGARLWQTEDSSQSATYDGGMTDGIRWALEIHNYLAVANVNAWVWWFLSNMPHQGEGKDNSALTDISGNIPKRAYVTGQWSKFVRPGWSRIVVSRSWPLSITAFKSPGSQSFAVVAINPSNMPITQTFALNGVLTKSVVPWITSSQWSLTAQAPLSVDGSAFSYTLPALSVTTFSGTVGIAR